MTPVLSIVPSTSLIFSDCTAHRAWLAGQSALPAGFRVGTTRFDFTPREAPKPAKMTLTLIALTGRRPISPPYSRRTRSPGPPSSSGGGGSPSPRWARSSSTTRFRTCAPRRGGRRGAGLHRHLAARFSAPEVWPSSTGVIGWSLPAEAIPAALPRRSHPSRAARSCPPPRAS